MAHPSRPPFTAMLLGLALLCLPLRAQLDPRLQTSKTDFLNLYQQSTSVKVKPEVLTIFDFSGSMEALMFHPLFVNTDVNDTGGASMSFSLNGSSTVVTASLGIAVGNKGSLSSTILVKPNGTQVTASDAAAASTTSGQYGASQGSKDVRNWVRAASHVRFNATVGGVSRTIDIPIPWKILNAASTGNPLSSVKVLDRQIKTATDGTITTYGSGTNVEMDLNYTFSSGSSVWSGNSTTPRTTTTLNTVTYRADYIVWLFSGKYTVGTYSGKFIVFDSAVSNLAGGQGALNWGQGFGSAATGNSIKVPNYNLNGTYAGTETTADASVNVVPALTRVQAVKRAAITTWISHQADVIWAFRFLDVYSEANPTNTNTIDNSSKSTFNVTAGNVTSVNYGSDSAWTVLNNTPAQGITSTSGNSVTGMRRIASLFANNGTPLTYAMARGLAQFTDPKSVFNDIETGADAPTQCMNHFIIVFTDGNDNNNTNYLNKNLDCAYLIPSGSTYKIDAIIGNQTIMGAKTALDRGGSYWSVASFAGAAAHLGDTALPNGSYMPAVDPGTSTTSGSPSSFLPLSIFKRGTTLFEKPHLVTTMTVGVSLGGGITRDSDPTKANPKYVLYTAAAVGDPTLSAWPDTATLTPFKWDPTANSGNGGRVAGSLYYFDATDPDKLSTSLNYAILSAIGASNINTSTNPNTPYIGSALGGEIYIAKFQPPTNGGSIWAGDMMMFGTKLDGDNLQILNKSGTITTTLDTTTAQWSAAAALGARNWWERKLFTRVPGTGAIPEPGLTTFSDQGAAFTTLQNLICQASNNPSRASYPVGGLAQSLVTQWVMGGDTKNLDTSNRAKTNRPNIMGDIIDSSPGALEYLYSDVSAHLTTRLAGKGDRFRLILVGTNQGWLHAFGEVTKQAPADASNSKSPIIAQGDVDELWAFMPTDFLGYLDQLTVTTNPHRFMVDGAPAVYHLDLPSTSGGAADGVVEVTTDPGPERAMVIFGLGKGGRSYYAIDIHDPYTPVLKWSIVPDEADLRITPGGAYTLQSRILLRPGAPSVDTVQKVIKNMGFSTCTPGIGRITITDSAGATVVRDAVFLGGGFSLPEVEVNYLDGSNNPTPMGRSVLAVDAYSGLILAAVDLSDTTASIAGNSLRPGPINRGLIPFEFILNSGMAQRAYFLDYWGGLWSWGCQKTDTASTNPVSGAANPTYQYRIDSSDLTTWTSDGNPTTTTPGIRLVAKDITGSLITQYGYSKSQQYYSEALYTTLPAPFRVGSFPGKPKASTSPTPAAVGIAFESGDKNNPLDYYYTTSPTASPANPATKPTHHRLSVVFDRQDSLAWGSMANPIQISTGTGSAVKDVYPGFVSYQATDASITPYSDSYFLAPSDSTNTQFGYFLNFPAENSKGLLPKGVNTPAVVSGSLFYSYFAPDEADPCKGGTGFTYSNKICQVLYPIVTDTRKNLSCTSGFVWKPYGIASDYIPLGTRGVIQIGTTDSATGGATTTALAAQTILGESTTKFPKARVWRTVH